MTRGTHFAIAVILCVALAAPDVFAQTPKKRSAKPVAYPATFNVGQLQMTGRKPKPTTYNVGTLQMTGRPNKPANYNIGTLTMTGLAHKPATYHVGTLQMTGNFSPGKQTSKSE